MALTGAQNAASTPFSLCDALRIQRGSKTESFQQYRPIVKHEVRCHLGERLRQRRSSISPSQTNLQQSRLSVDTNRSRQGRPRVVGCASSATRTPASAEDSLSSDESQASGSNSSSKGKLAKTLKSVSLKLTPLTKENFAPYGQVCGPSPDNVKFGESPEDAYLELEGGIPRFYILRLKGKKLKFDRITHHARVTQCLGSADGRPWYMGVAPPSILSDVTGEDGRLPWAPPAISDVRVFKIEGSAFIKLNKGTWHAGPLFETPQMDFYNLEHTDTNVTDHNTHVFSQHDGVEFVIDTD